MYWIEGETHDRCESGMSKLKNFLGDVLGGKRELKNGDRRQGIVWKPGDLGKEVVPIR